MDSSQPAPPTDLLLAHAEFVASLSARLVRPGADAEDLQQETLLSALQHPPADAGALRAWLGKVARNHALQNQRARMRRAAREQWASHEEALPSTDEIVARENARRGVVDALTKLDEPYRSTLLLRFYEDLPPREVARRTGVPVETARTRIKRGLALLREDLDRRSSGDRSAWVSALLPLAAPKLALEQAGGGVGSVLGVVLLVLGGIVATLAVAVWNGAPGASAPTPVPALAQSTPLETGAEAPANAAAAQRVTSVRARLVRVVRADDLPVANVLVRWRSAVDGAAEEQWLTDELGASSLPHALVPGDSLQVLATDATRALALRLAPAHLEGDEWRLVVERCSSVRGRVTDARGAPQAGVQVWALPPDGPLLAEGAPRSALAQALSDASGAFALLELPQHFYLHASSAHASLPRGLEFEDAEPSVHRDLELVLEPTWRVAGRVVDEGGRAVAGAELAAWTHDRRGAGRAARIDSASWRNLLRHTTRSREDGTFEFVGGLPAISHNLSVEALDHSPLALRVVGPEPDQTLVLSRAARLRVRSASDVELPSVVEAHTDAGRSLRAPSSAGEVEFSLHPGERRVVLKLQPAGGGAQFEALQRPSERDHSQLVEVQRGRRLRVSVVDEHGAAAPGADVVVSAVPGPEWDELGRSAPADFLECARARSGTEGEALFVVAPRQALLLRARAEDGDSAERVVEPHEDFVELRLGAARTERTRVNLRVIDALDGSPVEGCVLSARLPRSEGLRSTSARFDGATELDLDEPGEWSLFVLAPGHAPLVRRVALQRGANAVELALSPERELRARVLDSRGVPVRPGRLVFVDPAAGSGLLTRVSADYWANHVELPEQGEVVVRGLPARTVRVIARSAQFDGPLALELDLRAAEAHYAELVVPCDLSSARRRVEFVWPSAELAAVAGWLPEVAPKRGDTRRRLEVYDAAGVLCGRYRMLVDPAGSAEFVHPWLEATMRMTPDGGLGAASAQRLESDALWADGGPQWSEDGAHFSVFVPSGACRAVLTLDERAVLAASLEDVAGEVGRFRPLAR
ncbi:MAG: sigma-70 family RNA polymerase sigma factor [Planctomycetes bacterium]|nr:sigma-70 family RNA polymerase sigma factor [Planctomycetota bacterium]